MRYLLAIFFMTLVLVAGLLGVRGQLKRRPPLQILPDMKQQMKLRPLGNAPFFGDGRASRPLPPSTVPRSAPLLVAGRTVYPYEEAPVNTGRPSETSTNFIKSIPLAMTDKFLARGRQRYEINCRPCHGADADGRSPSTKLGVAVVANLRDKRIAAMSDGEVFHTITHGKNLMAAYGPLITVADRWAIVAYLRTLQKGRLADTAQPPVGAGTPLAPPRASTNTTAR